MEKKTLYQDRPTVFPLLLARIIGFVITGVYILFFVPEFIILLGSMGEHTEAWIFLFYVLSLTYGLGFLLTFWKMKLGSYILLVCGIGITLYGFLDSMRWEVFLILLPLSLPGLLFLNYWRKHLKPLKK